MFFFRRLLMPRFRCRRLIITLDTLTSCLRFSLMPFIDRRRRLRRA